MKTLASLFMIAAGLLIILNVNNLERRFNKRYDRKARKNKNWWVRRHLGKWGYFYIFHWELIGGAAGMLIAAGFLLLFNFY